LAPFLRWGASDFLFEKKVTTAPLAARTAKPARRASAAGVSQENTQVQFEAADWGMAGIFR
jgi:hypothetical protein